jgi:hypothetical protein
LEVSISVSVIPYRSTTSMPVRSAMRSKVTVGRGADPEVNNRIEVLAPRSKPGSSSSRT